MWEPRGIRVNYTSLTERIEKEFKTRFGDTLIRNITFERREKLIEWNLRASLWSDEYKTIILEERPIHPVIAIQEYEWIITELIDDLFEIIQGLAKGEDETGDVTGEQAFEFW